MSQRISLKLEINILDSLLDLFECFSFSNFEIVFLAGIVQMFCLSSTLVLSFSFNSVDCFSGRVLLFFSFF